MVFTDGIKFWSSEWLIYDTVDRHAGRQTTVLLWLCCVECRSCAVIGCNIVLLATQSEGSSYCMTFSRRERKISNMPDIQKRSGCRRRARFSAPCLIAVHNTHGEQNVGDESPILLKIGRFVGEQQKYLATTKSGQISCSVSLPLGSCQYSRCCVLCLWCFLMAQD